MSNQSYEEYMRVVLGYPVQTEDTYRRTEDCYDMNMHMNNSYQDSELEKMYPEVYKTIYPKVCNVCQKKLNSDITQENLEDMINEVYTYLETEGNINFYINIENRNESQVSNNIRNSMNRSSVRKTEERQDRQRNNALLDIIRIVILRELLNRPGRPGRPQFPGQGPRPPMPPTRPPFSGPGPRPF